ncbi:hypothetical protein [Candidatus Villigracilis saccharophilus]|uniref:hypothetical protein n=1 Tax=Candidatus Villigracilis saccharophilus TaxID=3140684 RepID=UPI003136C68A|nr:hypothetical protein [Anaerolineales bacterium]
MKRKSFLFMILGAMFTIGSIVLAACGGSATMPPFATLAPTQTQVPPTTTPEPEENKPAEASASTPGDAAHAVDLIGDWVNAGSPETEEFSYTGNDGNSYKGTFEKDILPLFTTNGVWYEGAQACTGCHFGNTENSYHEMNLTTYEGILLGADSLSAPPGVSILGAAAGSGTDFDWNASKLRSRLRNNRMPPGWTFDITEGNRDGLCVEVGADGAKVLAGQYGCDLNGASLIGAWVDAGAPETDAFEYGGAQLIFERDVLPFFTQAGMWFDGSQACTGCHFGNTENSYHEMDLSSYEGIVTGADSLSAPPGVSILGASAIGETDFHWDASKLRERLRNNRMPPGIEFDITEENRDGPLVLHGAPVEVSSSTAAAFGTGQCEVKAVSLIGDWVNAGSPEADAFPFTADDGSACDGTFEKDILPLFTTNGVWYEGAQACTGCHFGNTENSYHEMNLTTYEGILLGADSLSAPPGVSILGSHLAAVLTSIGTLPNSALVSATTACPQVGLSISPKATATACVSKSALTAQKSLPVNMAVTSTVRV